MLLTTFLPFCLLSVAGVDAEMIVVGCGALLGLGIFLRGFHLLQSHRPALDASDLDKPPTGTNPSATSFARREEALPLGTHREIIRLSPANAEESTTRARTQQGQIAAALLKAGIASPITWSAPTQVSEVSVRTIETPADRPDAPASLMETLNLNASTALREGRRISQTALQSAPQEFRWKPALMIWGGPILFLGCIYLLAAHYGWL